MKMQCSSSRGSVQTEPDTPGKSVIFITKTNTGEGFHGGTGSAKGKQENTIQLLPDNVVFHLPFGSCHNGTSVCIPADFSLDAAGI